MKKYLFEMLNGSELKFSWFGITSKGAPAFFLAVALIVWLLASLFL